MTKPKEDLQLTLAALNVQHPGASWTRSDLVQFKNQLKRQIKAIFQDKNSHKIYQ